MERKLEISTDKVPDYVNFKTNSFAGNCEQKHSMFNQVGCEAAVQAT
jgi:hypothetical protein